jgi:hypothetical protein
VTLPDVMAAAAITLNVTGAAFALIIPAHGFVQVQPETADMHQRLRVAADTLMGAIREARAIDPLQADALWMEDADGVPQTYYLDDDVLRRASEQSDVPVVDHVVGLSLSYVGGGEGEKPLRVRVRLRIEAAPASLRGPAGPLFVNGGTSTASERWLPDQSIEFDVSPRLR